MRPDPNVLLRTEPCAECGGMMALFEQLRTTDGQDHALWGLLPGRATMQSRLAALGPQQLVLDGQVLRGHTFHFSTCDTALPVRGRTARPGQPPAAGQGEVFYAQGALRASYFHAWFPSSPRAVARLFSPEEATQ